MNELWPKFIERAITKHMTQYNIPWQLLDDVTSALPRYCELRTDGPWIQQNGRNTFHAEFDINILISVVDANLYDIEEIGGGIMFLLTQPISILDDSGTLIECAKPMYDRFRKLQLNKFGKIAVDTNLEQATVENRYEVDLQGV